MRRRWKGVFEEVEWVLEEEVIGVFEEELVSERLVWWYGRKTRNKRW